MKTLFTGAAVLLALSPAYLIISLVYLYGATLNFFEQGRSFETVSALFINSIITSLLVLLCYIVYGHFLKKRQSHQ